MFRTRIMSKDGAEVILREPVASDAKAMLRYINSVIREERSGILMDRPFSLKQEEQWLKERLAETRKRTTVILVAEIDGKIVGNCQVSRRPWKERHRAAIGVALVKGARGRGIGRALMQETMRLAERRMPGLESFDLSVLDYNDSAQALYRSLGFVEVGRIPQAMKDDGDYVDEKIMIRLMRTGKRSRGSTGNSGRDHRSDGLVDD